MLPEEAVNEYKELCSKLLGVELSSKEASFRANKLVDLYRAIYSPKDNTKPKHPLAINKSL